MPEWLQQTSWLGQAGSSKLKKDWSWRSPDCDIWLWWARWQSDEQGWVPFPQPLYDRAQGKERQDLVLEEVRAGVEDVRISRMMSLQQQGTSTRWEGALERKLTWNDICKAEPQSIKLMIQSVYDMLPSPANLHVWGKKRPCLCPGRGTLEHILSSYPTTLGGGRYRW